MAENIFISYATPDRAWAHWIGVTLRDHGYAPIVDDWEIGAGENIARWMDESLDRADRFIGVFTDAYTRAIHSSAERYAAYWEDPQGRKGFQVPVEVEPVTKWPRLTVALKRLSLVGLSEDQAEGALIEFLKPPEAPRKRPPYPRKWAEPRDIKSRSWRLWRSFSDRLLGVKYDVGKPLSWSELAKYAANLPEKRPAWPSSTESRRQDQQD